MPRIAVPPDVREAVLDAAMRLMERYGYKKMTMEEIAQEAHIGKATIYSYFNNKEDVALSVIDRYQQKLQAQWRDIIATEATPDTRLRQMLLTQVLTGFDTALRYGQSMDETLASLRHVMLPRRDYYRVELARILMVVLQQGCEEGLFACPDVQTTACTLLICLSGLNPSNLSPRELGKREEIATRTNQVIDLMLTGLLVREEAAPE